MDFGDYKLKVGQYDKLFDWSPVANDINADTNFKFTLELLFHGAHFQGIPKYEISHLYNDPNPLARLARMVEFGEGAFDPDAGWIHLQTMAYHIYGMYWDLGEREALSKQRGDVCPHRFENNAVFVGEQSFTWSHILRIAWIWEFMSIGDYTNIDKYYKYAKDEIDWIVKYIGADPADIKYCQKQFHNLIWGSI
jgi:hypothetical protein